MRTLPQALHETVAAVCPINGVSVGRRDDKKTWRINYASEATDQEKAAANAALAAFDPAAPEDTDALDTDKLNAALAEPGSVTRALAELLFGVMKGTITANPSLTKAQFVAALKSKMRKGA